MKSTHKYIMTGIAIASGFLPISSCNQVENVTQSNFYEIQKPFKAIDILPGQYAFSNTRDTVIKAESGTSIFVPANTIVDKNKKPVKGSVKLKYREFHKPLDILVSGIPMKYDTGGTTYGFESAGMFEIAAVDANNEPLYIKEGSNIDVQMASYRKGDDYSLYYFDSTQGSWQYLDTRKAELNDDKSQRIDSISLLADTKVKEKNEIYQPKACKKGDKILNLDIDYSMFTEFRPFHSVIWRYAGSGGKDDPASNAWIYDEKWGSITLARAGKDQGQFILRLKSRKKEFSTVVEAVLQGKDLRKAENEFQAKVQEYNKIISYYNNEKLRVQREADLTRAFTVRRFGIYNCDRILNDENRVSVMAYFDFDKVVPGAENARVYHIIGSRNAVISYSAKQDFSFSFVPYEDNKLLAVLPDEQIAVFSVKEFNDLKLDQYADSQRRLKFTLKVKKEKVSSSKELSDVLASL